MTNTIPKRGDVFFCQGSPDAIGSEERKTRPVVIIQNDAGNASSPTVIVANMTTNTSRRLYPMQFDIDLPGHSPSRVQCEQIRTVDKCRLRERIYTLTGEELRKLDICLAVSFGMTRQAAQEAAHSAPEAQDDIFHELTRNGLSVAVCPLPALNQVNITITDRKTVSMTRNVAPAGADRGRTSGYEGHAERGDAVSRSEEAAKKLAEALDIPEDQVLPCVVAFACLRYHGKSFVRKLANGTGPITTWQSLKIGVALFLWGRAQKKDPWGELYRITKFAQAWKEGDSI